MLIHFVEKINIFNSIKTIWKIRELNKAISKYVYSTWLKRNTANGGYVKYNYNEAVYTGKK